MRYRKPQRSGSTPSATTNRQYTQRHYNVPQLTPEAIVIGAHDAELTPTYEQAAQALATPGEWVRVAVSGKSPSNDGGSILVTPDFQSCQCSNFVNSIKQPILAGRQRALDPAEIARRKAETKKRNKERDAKKAVDQNKAALIARDSFHKGCAFGEHRYIDDKQLAGLHNARIALSTRKLLIPMFVSDDRLANLQIIEEDGTKRHIKGGRVQGAYCVIGSLNCMESVFVTTGWATGATLREATGLSVVVAFSDGNLMAVCQSLRNRLKDIAMVVAGDDDRQNTINTGRQKAEDAARAIGGTYALPELCKCCTCTDFNDAAVCARRCGRA